jgi:hypothetical protein
MTSGYLIINPVTAQNLRRLALFLAMLMSGGNLIFPRLPLMIGILALCLLCKGITLGVRREMTPIILVLMGVFVVAIIGYEGIDLVAVATRYANFIVGVALLGLYLTEPRDTISKDLLPIFRLMGAQAFLTIVFALFASNLFSPVIVGETIYYTILWVFTYHVTISSDTGLVRPDGFFFEPSAFQIYMNLFLFISLFITRKKSDIFTALASVFMIQSTTGILIGLFLVAAYSSFKFKTSNIVARFLLLAVAPFVVMPLLVIASMNIESKITGEYRGSTWARQYDFYTGLNVIRANPVFGIGFDYERYKTEAQRVGYDSGELAFSSTADRTNSNGLLMLIISIGIPMSLPFLFAIFRQRFFKPGLVFGVLLGLSFMGQAIMLTPFFLMIIFSAMLTTRQPTSQRRFWSGQLTGREGPGRLASPEARHATSFGEARPGQSSVDWQVLRTERE